MTDALKPCPFCGSTRLREECTGAAEISGHTYQTGWVECLNCGGQSPTVDLTDETPAQNDYQLVRDAWNRRAAPAVPAGWVLETGVGGFGEKGDRWVCVRHLESQCGQDFYEDRDLLIFAFLSALAAAPGAPDAREGEPCKN